ncbi:alpha-mannosidase [Paenibacillus oryzae]|uniref:Alpha-mannosidase n=1 Tax=Paenibacillus oryzae TaxID=1844972 RepID=A0A1A5YSK2_9BACL|nr:alpha-mannosidase [Paenibacillus oryzae]OBR68395.1 alpha-mannosidase [Paenibacillus oryzae]
MTAKRTAHLISHTHWDREWYLPYEKHHVLLIELMDTLLDTMERDPEFRSFHLDGQTIIIDDYLQVRPEKRELLTKYIKEGRIQIGPWYILQDAFLTSSEANVRNMQIGHADARPYGQLARIGYFPDTFGNMGQAPQILKQAGIDNAVFGRGVKPTGFNNTVSDGDYESAFSELIWEGPDGSRVLGVLFANWYCNGMEVPVDPAEAKVYWDKKLEEAEKYAATGQLLFMNGCDHQPVQTDLSQALAEARKLYPDTEFLHSSFEEYLTALRNALPDELSVVKGELRSQRTDGWSTLVNTASARVYLKQMNQAGQTLLEKVAEPLAALAYWSGADYPHHLFTYAWKTLMQNHPHDSICGCSVDEVHREMVTRFDKSRHVTETIVDDASHYLAGKTNTSAFAAYGENALPFVVFNSTGWERSGVVEVEIDIARIYYRDGEPLNVMNQKMKTLDISGRVLVDAGGKALPCTVTDLGLQFGYDLPKDKFRQPYMCRRVKLSFHADNVPALGWAAYAYVLAQGNQAATAAASGDASASAISPDAIAGDGFLENQWLRVDIAVDGSYSLKDKTTGRVYTDLGVYENTGDIGNEYMYKQPNGEVALLTKGLQATIEVLQQGGDNASISIVHQWEIPASAEEGFEDEKQEAVYFPERTSQRSKQTVPFTIRTVLSISRSSKALDVETSFNNQAKDHRLRALFPTDIAAATHNADAIFEVAVRSNEPAAEWTNPSNCQHQQAFADVSGEGAGLTVANQGLHEYEVLRDGRNTIAVTLLRAVAELGDWGVFPTPEAQCLGESTVRLSLIPHGGNGAENDAYASAYQYQAGWVACQTDLHEGTLPAIGSGLSWNGTGVAFSSMKVSEQTGDIMLRWFNMQQKPSELQVRISGQPGAAASLYKSDILEQVGAEQPKQEAGKDAAAQAAAWTTAVGPCEILTLGLVPASASQK